MSDSRSGYPSHTHLPHPHYPESFSNQAYVTSSLSSARSQHPSALYGHAHAVRDGQQLSHPSSFPANAFPVPPRSTTPSLAGNPQIAYSQSTSRHRTSSISAMQTSSSGHYGHAQNLVLSSNGHHRTQSQLHAPTASHAGYPSAHPQADYLHPSTTPAPSSSADYYYGHSPNMQDMQMFKSSQRPFPCDMCALSFNRQHDLKRHRETHSGERPYLCNGGCGKTFTRKDALKRHQLVKSCGRSED